MNNNKKPWGSRFNKSTNKLLEKLSESVSYDWQLYKYDIAGSSAHAKMLNKIDILTDQELQELLQGLCEIEKEIDEGNFVFDEELEDIHMNIETALIAKVGDVGKKIHTGRSRNDQVSLDVRLFLRDKIKDLIDLIKKLQKSLAEFSKKNIDIIIPEFTHLQHAQPVLLAHHMLAYVEMLNRDRARLEDAEKRINIMPLGSGACVGSGINLDREFIAKELNFPKITQNSVDAVSDRDFIIEILSCLSIIAMHLSRLSEEFILWSGTEFSYIKLDDAFCTGSSMMPQKKNPDVCELVRGKTGQVYGSLVSVLTMMKGLPLAYNRDMQGDKRPLFEAVNNISLSLEIFAELIEATEVNKDICRNQAEKGFAYATDIADYLVRKACPFREAHHIVGRLVSDCIEQNIEVSNINLETLKEKYSNLFEQDIYDAIKIDSCINSKDIIGGTAKTQVKKQIDRFLSSIHE